MARPLRIEFAGAVYHVTSRGDRRERIFDDDADRVAMLNVVAQAMQRFDASVLTYCLMGNHYHLVLCTARANLSLLMRHVNGVYTQYYNRRHGLVGHLLQGRFKAILVDRDAYMLALTRYVELNPVRADMVGRPRDWAWSSYRSHVGLAPVPTWLDSMSVHATMLQRQPETEADHLEAAALYAKHVAAGEGADLWGESLRQQIYLGDQAFVERMQTKAGITAIGRRVSEVPKDQTSPPHPLQHYLDMHPDENHAMRAAHVQGGISLTAIARHFNRSVSWASKRIGKCAF